MNIAVYVSSNYSNYDEFSKLLPKYLGKYTQSPVLLTALSPSTKDGHGNKMVKRYADEHKLRCKVYETEWNRFKRSAGSISSYHLSHNSEHSIVFWDGMSRGCKNLLQMAVRLNRPCDLVRLNPSNPNANIKEEPKQTDTSTQPSTQPSTPTTAAPRVGTTPRMPTTPSAPSSPTTPSAPSAPSSTPTPSTPTTPSVTAPNNTVQTNGTGTAEQPPTDAIGKEFVKNTTTPSSAAPQTSQNTPNGGVAQQPPVANNTSQNPPAPPKDGDGSENKENPKQ